MSDVSDDRLVATFLKIRDESAAHAKAYEAEHKRFTDAQSAIQEELLRRMNERGNDGFKTSHGAVYRAETVRCSMADEAVVWDWIAKNQAFDAVEKRIKSTFVQDYIKEHGEAPPGVNVFREFSARVRASK